MALTLESRHVGKVYVIRGAGRIVAGEEQKALEAAIEHGLREFTRLLLHAGEIERIDSTGMGLLVRYAAHCRNRGGDLRLAAPTGFVSGVLQMTRLASVLRVAASEDEGILSFLKEHSERDDGRLQAGQRVLFLDQSADLCAFVRTVLTQHGYDVLSTSHVRDAKVLLSAAGVDYVVLGPDFAQLASKKVIASLKDVAPHAAALVLARDFKHHDAHHAGSLLLDLLRNAGSDALRTAAGHP